MEKTLDNLEGQTHTIVLDNVAYHSTTYYPPHISERTGSSMRVDEIRRAIHWYSSKSDALYFSNMAMVLLQNVADEGDEEYERPNFKLTADDRRRNQKT